MSLHTRSEILWADFCTKDDWHGWKEGNLGKLLEQAPKEQHKIAESYTYNWDIFFSLIDFANSYLSFTSITTTLQSTSPDQSPGLATIIYPSSLIPRSGLILQSLKKLGTFDAIIRAARLLILVTFTASWRKSTPLSKWPPSSYLRFLPSLTRIRILLRHSSAYYEHSLRATFSVLQSRYHRYHRHYRGHVRPWQVRVRQ